jgi:hypothetical protein
MGRKTHENPEVVPPPITEYFKENFIKAGSFSSTRPRSIAIDSASHLDEDHTGQLDTEEFEDMLRGMVFKLTEREISQIHVRVDGDNDGVVEW